jgi:hypothetical protein
LQNFDDDDDDDSNNNDDDNTQKWMYLSNLMCCMINSLCGTQNYFITVINTETVEPGVPAVRWK